MPPTRSTEQPVDSAVSDPAAPRARRARRATAPTGDKGMTSRAATKTGTTSKTAGKTGTTRKTAGKTGTASRAATKIGTTGRAAAPAPAPPTEPTPTSPTPPAVPAPPAQPTPPNESIAETLDESAGPAVAYAQAVRRQAASAASRRARQAPRPGPVQQSNALDGLPEPLRRLALRSGDVRKVTKVHTSSGALAIEMDMATARFLSLVQ